MRNTTLDPIDGTSGSRTHIHQGLSLTALPICVPCRFRMERTSSLAAPPMGFEPTISTLTGWRALRTAPRGREIAFAFSRSSRLDMISTGGRVAPRPGLNPSVPIRPIRRSQAGKTDLRARSARSSAKPCPGPPRADGDRPGVSGVGYRSGADTSSPYERPHESHPDLGVNSCVSSSPRSQALRPGRHRVAHHRDATAGRDVRARRRVFWEGRTTRPPSLTRFRPGIAVAARAVSWRRGWARLWDHSHAGRGLVLLSVIAGSLRNLPRCRRQHERAGARHAVDARPRDARHGGLRGPQVPRGSSEVTAGRSRRCEGPAACLRGGRRALLFPGALLSFNDDREASTIVASAARRADVRSRSRGGGSTIRGPAGRAAGAAGRRTSPGDRRRSPLRVVAGTAAGPRTDPARRAGSDAARSRPHASGRQHP